MKKPVKINKTTNGITQVQIQLTDINPQVKNKKIIISTYEFKDLITFFYEKHFIRNGKNIREHYTNNKLENYYEIERIEGIEITKGYGANDLLYFTEVVNYNCEPPKIEFQEIL